MSNFITSAGTKQVTAKECSLDRCCGFTICKQCVNLASTIRLTVKWKPRDVGGLKSLRRKVVPQEHLLEEEIPFSKFIVQSFIKQYTHADSTKKLNQFSDHWY